jgi:hypothetical protein
LDRGAQGRKTALSLGERVASVASPVRGYLVGDAGRPLEVTPHPSRSGW